jgi:ABC-type branched-subunit amino acid transport system ATPase component
MPKRLADRLREVRQSRFVGRDAEQIVFQTTLTAQALPVSVLYIFGPGGVGKTTLLNRFVDLCDQAGIPFVRLDGREIDATPEQFVHAIGVAMGLRPDESRWG